MTQSWLSSIAASSPARRRRPHKRVKSGARPAPASPPCTVTVSERPGNVAAVPDPSQIYFPLGSNASALHSGPGVTAVRRRILAAALLHDHVMLEPGEYHAFATPTGASSTTVHGAQPTSWQSLRRRGQATGANHYVAVRSDDAPADAPFHPLISGPAVFSWHATYEPFRRELPASASSWLDFGAVDDDRPAKDIVRVWEQRDRTDATMRWLARGRVPGPEPPGGKFAYDSILKAGYYDLAIASVTRSAVSIDRRHQIAVARQLQLGEAARVAGPIALEVLLPTDFGWEDVADLRRMRALRDYRAIISEIEAAALDRTTSVEDLERQIHGEYATRLAAATARGVPFTGRLAMTGVGIVLGALADTAAPVVGSTVVGGAGFALAEAADRALKPRWLSVHRRAIGRRPEGI